MFWHDYPCQEVEASFFSCGLELIDEGVFDLIVVEEWELVVGGECEVSGVVFLFDSFHFLVVGHGLL